jgi:hypothetical protein
MLRRVLEEGAKQWHLLCEGAIRMELPHLGSRILKKLPIKAPGRKILVYLQVILQSVEKSWGILEN